MTTPVLSCHITCTRPALTSVNRDPGPVIWALFFCRGSLERAVARFTRQSIRPWYLQDCGFRVYISTLKGPVSQPIFKIFNFTNPQILDTNTQLWEAVWEDLDNDANGEWSPKTYRALTTQKSIEGFCKWYDRYPPCTLFLNTRYWYHFNQSKRYTRSSEEAFGHVSPKLFIYRIQTPPTHKKGSGFANPLYLQSCPLFGSHRHLLDDY